MYLLDIKLCCVALQMWTERGPPRLEHDMVPPTINNHHSLLCFTQEAASISSHVLNHHNKDLI